MPDPFRITISQNIDSISEDWPTGLVDVQGVHFHAFQSAVFLKVWLASFGRSGQRSLHFVEVRNAAGSPLIFMPLCISRRDGVRILEFIDGDAADYNAPILFDTDFEWTEERANQLWRQVTEALPAFDLLLLSKMPADIDGVINPLSFIGDRPNAISCHANDLRRSWTDIEAGVPQKKTLLRKMRQIERMVPLEFLLADSEQERQEATQAFIRQKQWRFEQTHVPGFDVDTDKRDFFQEGTEVFAKEGMLRLFYLKAADEIIATIWALAIGKRCYAIMLSFEAGEWARYSPGSILYYRTLQWLHDRGYEWLDLGIGDEPWKLDSCETTFQLTAKLAPVTLAGRVFLLRSDMAASIRATWLWRTIRPMKWVLLRRFKQASIVP